MNIVDYSQTIMSIVHVFAESLSKSEPKDRKENLLRHSMINTIMSYAKEKKYGEVVLCMDSSNNWRKKVFAQYKASRAKGREESDIDFEAVFQFADAFREELRQFFPWKIVRVETAEADDCIAALIYWAEEHDLKSGAALFGGGEQNLSIIRSSDGDFKQLHIGKWVKQYSQIQKKDVKLDKQTYQEFLNEKIVTGDAGDGVPSVLMPDDWFTNDENRSKRAKPVTAKVKARFVAALEGKPHDLTDEELKNLNRNQTMIDLRKCPAELHAEAVRQYQAPREQLFSRTALYQYLLTNQMRNLIGRIEEF